MANDPEENLKAAASHGSIYPSIRLLTPKRFLSELPEPPLYGAKKVEAEHFHRKSIQIPEAQQFLKAALAMLDDRPNAGGEIARNTIRATTVSAKEGGLDRAGIDPLPNELAVVLMD